MKAAASTAISASTWNTSPRENKNGNGRYEKMQVTEISHIEIASRATHTPRKPIILVSTVASNPMTAEIKSPETTAIKYTKYQKGKIVKNNFL